MNYSKDYLNQIAKTAKNFNLDEIASVLDILVNVKREQGRLFILGVGGSAGNASHAVNDFRKLAGIEAYSATDNISELTARTNDDGWQTVFKEYLKGSNLQEKDCVLILSVGGGNLELGVSVNICDAIDYAKFKGSKIIGIVGRSDGYTKVQADACVLILEFNSPISDPSFRIISGCNLASVCNAPKIE